MNHRATRLRTITIAILAAASTTTLAFAAARGGDPVGGGDDVVDVPDYQTTWRSFTSSDTPDFYVSDPSESIQDAIDDAQDWDIIELGDGEWIETLNFQGKAIWLITYEDAQLRGEDRHTGTLLNHTRGILQQEGTASNYAHLRLSNLTFIGEEKTQCLQAQNATVEVLACSFENWNSTELMNAKMGGAIGVVGCDTEVRGCSFDACAAYRGGAIHTYGSSLVVTDSTFVRCESEAGGAIRVDDADVLIERSTFDSCTAGYVSPPSGEGGAISTSTDAPVTITDCHFGNNRADRNGGAIRHAGVDTLTVTDCSFVKNESRLAGAIFSRSVQVRRCSLTGNTSTYDEGMVIYICSGAVSQSRFCGNTIGTPNVDEYGIAESYGSNEELNVSASWLRPSLTCNSCESDLDIDGTVGITELLFLLNDWGKVSVLQDADGDRSISASDLVSLLADWGPCEEDSFGGGGSPIDLPF